jgi:para-nitrobenzyl esterase
VNGRREVLRKSLYCGGLLAAAAATRSPSVYAAGAAHTVAKTRAGRIGGVRAHGVHVFKGVPYGGDTAPRRFLPPVAPPAWQRVRDALDYGPACPQVDAKEVIGEDCLRLNVWTPSLRDGGKRPVMVYFHGGEYSTGSGSSPIYDGTRLCRRGDVVVVTVNHRLNALGHLYLARLAASEFAASGNVGLLDLVQALTWVREHAEEFGGDPARVTVFGQSGGGAKIATLMAMPTARDLFHRAATMSGQQITASGPRGATQRASTYLEALGVAPADWSKVRSIDVTALVEATRANDPSLAGRSLYFGPVLDQVSLPRHPFYPDAPPQSAGIPMMIGNTRDETRMFHLNDPGIFELSWNELPQRLLGALHVDIDPEHVVAEYRRMYPQYTASEVFFAASTAGRSWRGAIIEAELRAAQGSPVYAYQLDYRSPLAGGKYGAMHTMDIPLVFDNVAHPSAWTGSDANAQRVADQMSDAFIAFARTGNPNHTGAPEWRPYELGTRATMVFDVTSKLMHDPRGGERKLFQQVPYIQRGTY